MRAMLLVCVCVCVLAAVHADATPQANAAPLILPSGLRTLQAEITHAINTAKGPHCTCGTPASVPYPPCFIPNPTSPVAPCVPRIIHQTYKDTTIPQADAPFMASWRTRNPGWLHILWTDADILQFVALNYPGLVSVFVRYETNIQRSDAFRYLVLASIGGVYADLDYECLTPLDVYARNLTTPLAFVAPGNTRHSISNSLMISAHCPDRWQSVHDELIIAAQRIQRSWSGLLPRSRVLKSTGPAMLSEWLKRTQPTFACRLPTRRFSPCSHCDSTCNATGADAVHHYAKSWNRWDSRVANWWYCGVQNGNFEIFGRFDLWTVHALVGVVAITVMLRWHKRSRRRSIDLSELTASQV